MQFFPPRHSRKRGELLAMSLARAKWIWDFGKIFPSWKSKDERYFSDSRLNELQSVKQLERHHLTRVQTLIPIRLQIGYREAHAWRKRRPSVSSPANEKSKVYKPVFAQPTLVVLRLCSGRCSAPHSFRGHNMHGISPGSELKGRAWMFILNSNKASP